MRISEALLAASLVVLVSQPAARAQDATRGSGFSGQGFNGSGLVPPRPIPGIPVDGAAPPAPAHRGALALPANPPMPNGAAAAHSALPLAPFANARDAIRAWMRDSTSGNQAGAVRALEYAASQGHVAAQFKLGRMYAAGEGVPENPLKAFEYFSKIADENADESPMSADGRMVAGAFVALGGYFMDGIAGTYVRANPARAFDMFSYAATYFSDPDGQYNLGRLYMTGSGTTRDPRQAARWMKLAAEKGHVPARAVLGDMLIRGNDGVPRQVAQGLMWLTLARDAADPARETWIIERHETAVAAISPGDRQAAEALARRFPPVRGEISR